jgi:mono/diheme cytochrome c family protein
MRRGGGGGVAPVLAEPARREDSRRVNSSGRLRALALLGFLGIFAARAAGPTPEAIAQLPAATARKVDFRKDVQPILEGACVKCHGRGKANGDWKIDSRADFLKPAESGPAVVVGDSARSHFIHLVAGTDPDSVMPQKGTKLTRDQVAILRAWVDQGLDWDPQVSFAQPPPNNLKPRRPDLPPGRATHPVDRFTEAYFSRNGLKAPKTVDDRVFLRRASLDVTGLLPTPEAQEAFLKDRRGDPRGRLVQRLLEDRPRYAQHWLTFWNDLLRNDYAGTGYIDGGRKQISPWLYRALLDNMPYDRFVRELVNPVAGSEGFTKGIVWRGTVNASMTPPLQAAQNIGQVFMGVNLKCASCHDSFIDDWRLSDAYGLAGIYADGPLEMVQCDKPTGKVAPLRFLFPELGAVDAKAPKTNRLEQLARLITQRENGRLSRTIVNRLWARLMGRGLVEPLDVMQNAAWDPDLLDWLAEDLVEHHWDLKRTLGLILTSRAYQMPTVDLPEKPEAAYTFRGPGVRRLSAEQFRDALGSITGVWADKPSGDLDRLLAEPGQARSLSTSAFWIWSDVHAATRGVPPGTNAFRKDWVLDAIPSEATLFVHADNSARVFLNGKRVRGAEASDWMQSSVYDLRGQLRVGTNQLAIEAVNGGDGPNPAGVLAYARVRQASPASAKVPAGKPGKTSGASAEVVMDFGSDASWKVSTHPAGSWQSLPASEGWVAASILGVPGMAPWNVEATLAQNVSGRQVHGSVRASLIPADPLALALGRPNREQVVTTRQSLATTLQALELTNGDTLAKLLKRGSEKLVATHPDGRSLAQQVFRQGLCRPPTRQELAMTLELVGDKPRAEGVEDLLWSVALLPEFQLTH